MVDEILLMQRDDQIIVRLPKRMKVELKKVGESTGLGLTNNVLRWILEGMNREQGKRGNKA